ncbi:MAG: hypothetical protein ABI723_27280 [Bacteroidia bacterium]
MHKRTILSFYFIILAVAGFTSCELINPSEPVPAYLSVDSVSFTTFYNTQGTASTDIIDGWVYVDNVLQGAYQLPFNIPITETGTHTISIRPGIKVDGISSFRSTNPLYNFYDTIVNLEPGKTTKVFPRCSYVSGATFYLIDDFDDGGNKFVRDADSDTSFFSASFPDAFEGSFSGGIYLDDNHLRFSAITIDHYTLPKGSTNLLELNYKCNNSFVVGVKRTYFGQSIREELLTVLSSDNKWKKIYISLVDEVNTKNADYYNVYFFAQRNATSGTAQIFLDNIKLVHN